MNENKPDYLKTYAQIEPVPVRWLWEPYIPMGKITLLLGESGSGKTGMALDLVTRLSNGSCLLDNTEIEKPMCSIYQITPSIFDDVIFKLSFWGANTENVMFLDEKAIGNLELDDKRIEEAIIKFRPALFVIDDFHWYFNKGYSNRIVERTRKYMKQLSKWAAKYDCAILILCKYTQKSALQTVSGTEILHLARSVLQINTDTKNPNVKTVTQTINKLSAPGKDIHFQLDANNHFIWFDPAIKSSEKANHSPTKTDAAVALLRGLLKNGMVPSNTIMESFHSCSAGERTLRQAKKQLGIKSIRKNGHWYWSLPDD